MKKTQSFQRCGSAEVLPPKGTPQRLALVSSAPSSDREQRHPVDALADVRKEIKSLEGREQQLRDLILSQQCTLDGHEFEASISVEKSERLDTKAIRKEFGLEKLRPYLVPAEKVTVRLRRL